MKETATVPATSIRAMAKRKTSPDLVPWGELSPEEQRKDRDAVRELPALLQRAGFRIYRLDESASAERKDEDGKQG